MTNEIKIKVKPEGREGVWLIEKTEAINLVNKVTWEKIHCYIGDGVFFGADYKKSSVIKAIKKAERIALLTGKSLQNNLNHALAVIKDNELNMFDIGEITVEQLEIQGEQKV